MIIDFRTYTYQPAGFYRFLAMYKEFGFAITSRWLGTTLGIFTSHSGKANRTLQLFAYRDFIHRDECRAGLRQDGEWHRFIKDAAPFISEQENVILETDVDAWPWLAPEGTATAGGAGLFELRRERALPSQASRLFDAWVKLPPRDEAAPSAQRLALCPLTGALDTVYIMERFAGDAERHLALRNGSDRPPLHAAPDQQLSIQSIESELWLPTDYSPSR